MGRKIFVSYKYSDSSVQNLDIYHDSTARDYVDKIEKIFDGEDHIYKGEHDDEDLSQFKDSTIASKLRDKIYDSTVTIVLISPNMKDFNKNEIDQWIPYEISYSLKEPTRNGVTSHMNAMLGVVLPDSNGSYKYCLVNNSCCSDRCTSIISEDFFTIIKKNLFNQKKTR